VSRTDGAIAVYSVSPYPLILERLCAGGSWEKAIRLCRYAKRRELWACLAGALTLTSPIFPPYVTLPILPIYHPMYFLCLAAMAVNGKEIYTAEVAYAAIDAYEKVVFMNHIKVLGV